MEKPHSELGIAAGLDKDASCLHVWDLLGFGFVEIGTIVRHPQTSNPGVILRRGKEVLWNAMGFPSKGYLSALHKVGKYRAQGGQNYLIASLGSNRNIQNFEQIFIDISMMIEEFEPFVNAFSINFASPNTKNLRDKMKEASFQKLLVDLRTVTTKKIFLKLHPDFESEVELEEAVQLVNNAKFDGVIFSNTTKKRPMPWNLFPDHGGLSGKVLRDRNLSFIPLIRKFLEKDKILIGCGGIMGGGDIIEYKNAGSQWVQVYSGLVLHPWKLITSSQEFRKRIF